MSAPTPDPHATGLPVGRAMLLAGGVAVVLALAVSASVYLSMLNHGHSFARMFGWQIGNWGYWALLAPLVLKAGERLGGGQVARLDLALWTLAGLALMALHATVTAAFTVTVQPFYPIDNTRPFVDALVGQLPSLVVIDTLVLGILLASGSAYGARQRARQLDLRESRLEAALARAQLDALRLEIQPHFLFNTLNSVSALIRLKEHDNALRMLIGLSDLLRAAVDQPKDQLVALTAELDFVRRYVDLQRVRFADRLDVRYEIAEDCAGLAVPTFLLQPLVENALRHGAAPRPGMCHLEIGASADSGRLRLWVTDDGAGLPRDFDLDRHAGTGLSNTRSRLSQLYGAAATFEVRAGKAAGTIVEIAFPASTPLAVTAPAT
jgi:two-component system, LytTR family, sensor kinase